MLNHSGPVFPSEVWAHSDILLMISAEPEQAGVFPAPLGPFQTSAPNLSHLEFSFPLDANRIRLCLPISSFQLRATSHPQKDGVSLCHPLSEFTELGTTSTEALPSLPSCPQRPVAPIPYSLSARHGLAWCPGQAFQHSRPAGASPQPTCCSSLTALWPLHLPLHHCSPGRTPFLAQTPQSISVLAPQMLCPLSLGNTFMKPQPG